MINDEVKTIVASVTEHTRNSAKIWAVAATLVLLVVAADAKDLDDLFIFGIKLDQQNFYLYSSGILSSVSFAFVASELQGLRLSTIFREYLEDVGAAKMKFTNKSTQEELALSLQINAYNRVYSYEQFLPQKYRGYFYLYYKFPLDIVYFCLPIAGSVVALAKGLYGEKSNPAFFIFAIALAIVAAIATSVMVISSIKWTLRNTKNVKKRYIFVLWLLTLGVSYGCYVLLFQIAH